MAGYIRQSTFVDGDTITAALFNNEYNQLVNAFSNTSGHKHDGTTAEGPVIGLIGDAGETSPNNKVLIDTVNNYIEFYVEVSSAPVQQLYIADGAIIPVTDSDIDLGTTSLRFKDTYTDTVTTTGDVSIGGDLTVTGSATISGNLTFGDADTDSINLAAEIDSNIVPNTDDTYDLGTSSKQWKDLYINGTANIDSLVADTADINGGTIDGATIATSDITVGAGKTLNVSAGTLTLADNQISGDKVEGGTIAATTITTLTSTTGNITNVNATTVDSTNLEVTNLKAKDGTAAGSIADSTGVVTLGSSVLTTTDINGGTIDGVTIATSDVTVGTGKTLDVSSGTLTLADNQISGDKVEGGTIAATTITDLTFGSLNDGIITVTAFADEDDMSSNSATLIPTQQSVKAYVDSQVTAQDLDFQGDTGGSLSIDLDSESLTIAGGTGIDTSGATNTLTVAIDSTVATLTGTQTLTNKTLTTPVISSISNTGTLTLPTSTDTLVGRATTDTLTNKTLTSPVINTGVSGTAFLDDDTFATATASTLASSESIKAYVDTTVAATNEVVEDSTPQLGGDLDLNSNNITGTGNINITGTIQSSGNITGTLATAAQPNITSLGTLTGLTTTGDINFGDSDKAVFGADSDLEIYHDSVSGNSVIKESGTGDLEILAANLSLKRETGLETYLFAQKNAGVTLYYDNSPKLATTATGIDVTGVITTDGLTTSADINFGNGDRAIFGDDDTLQMYSNGANSYIIESGTGNFEIRADDLVLKASDNTETMARFNKDAEVTLAYNGETKFSTTSSGIDVTGTATMDGLTVDGSSEIRSTFDATLNITSTAFTVNSGDVYGSLNFVTEDGSVENDRKNAATIQAINSGGAGSYCDLDFYTSAGTGATNTKSLKIASNGDISFYNNIGTSQALFWDASTERLGIGNTLPTSALDVTGTVTADGLTVDGVAKVLGTAANTIVIADATETNGYQLKANTSASADFGLIFENLAGKNLLNIQSNGDIYFYDDTGTSEAMYWDASAEALGIGTTSPNAKLDVSSATGSSSITPTELLISSSTQAGDWSLTEPWGVLGFYSADTSGGGAGSLAEISANMENTVGAFASLDFKLQNSAQSYAKTSWLTLKNSSSFATRQVLIEADGGLYVEGNVGIGTSSPSEELTIRSSVPKIQIEDSDGTNQYGQFYHSAGTTAILARNNTSDGTIVFQKYDGTTTDETMRIDSSGNLLVGKSSSSISGAGTFIEDASIGNARINLTSENTGATVLSFYYDNGTTATQVGTIVTSTTATTYNTSSDQRLKDVTGEARGLEVINELNPVAYNWKADGKADEGLIAQEVLDIVPNAVSGSEEEMYQMDYSKLVVHLVKGMKEQQAQIEALQSEINLLKGE